jgi:hypothetical protein
MTRRPDLAVAPGDSSNIFTVLINNGAGSFAPPVTFTFPDFNFRPRAIEVGQFIGDGNLDVAVVINSGFSDSVSAVVIVAGNGAGSFNMNNFVTAPTGYNPVSITRVILMLTGAAILRRQTAVRMTFPSCLITAAIDTVPIHFLP